MARLVVESGADSGVMHQLPMRPVVIGRGEFCEISLSDRRISRRHSRILPTGTGFELEDLGSRNGTLLNHEIVAGRAPLRHGDSIIIGGTELFFELDPNEISSGEHAAARVLLAAGIKHTVQAEKPVDTDTAPVISQADLARARISDPLERLRVLYRMSDSLRGELDPSNVLAKTMQLIWGMVMPDRGIILLKESTLPNSDLKPVVVKTADGIDDDIVISQQVLEQSMQNKTAILMSDTPGNPHFRNSESIVRNRIQSIICAPLVAHSRAFGAIYVDLQAGSLQSGRAFTPDDLELMTGIANQVALAVDNARLYEAAMNHQRLERELEIARSIQEQLLPANYPPIPGLEYAALCNSARQVGGDYYDFFEVSDGRTAIIVADASGKGVPAAISVAMVRTAVRAHFRAQLSAGLSAIMGMLNSAFCQDLLRDSFITVCSVLYDPETQDVTYSSAGHVPPLLFRRDGELEELSAGGPLFAAMENQEYSEGTVRLSPGDLLVIYSDGVTDTHNLAGQLFGKERLIDAVRQVRELPARNICDHIRDSVVRFREAREVFDDATLVVLKAIDHRTADNLTQIDD